MPNLPKSGRPRRTLDWASTLRYNLPVSFVKDRDIHTALFLAGTGAIDMVMCAIREYITNHPEETGYSIDPAVQQKVAATALAIAMGIDNVQTVAVSPPVPEPALEAPIPVRIAPVKTEPLPSAIPTHHSEPDDMVSRLRSAMPTTQLDAPKAVEAVKPAPQRTNLVAEISFPDDVDNINVSSDESRRLEAAHQFAINQLKDA